VPVIAVPHDSSEGNCGAFSFYKVGVYLLDWDAFVQDQRFALLNVEVKQCH
jgi:hypothetical protein